uniref:Large ribosomal subunit protein bL35m n=1 Tax=Timema californicum TaxID=61474 RepID=A0A7R9JDS7_TIMCA|nr:unnamed protein product [Timema californicum]
MNNIKAHTVPPVVRYSVQEIHRGGWIRTRSGRHKRLWKKKENLRRRLRQHVFCNSTQSWLLDKMVTKYWRQPRYYVDDPYEPYHTREEGGWIRTRSGRHKRLWKKKENLRRRLRQHVFCNSTQSWLLDKMVTKYWRQPRYYVDDPYEPYHTREEFLITRKKPLP